MTRTEQIQQARHDVEVLQDRLHTVDTLLHGAEEVAIAGERMRSRLPLVLATVAVVAVAVGIGVVAARRRRQAADGDEA